MGNRNREYTTELGGVLSYMRQRENIGITEQAKKFGVTAGFISIVSYGDSVFSIETAKKIYYMYADDKDLQRDFAIAWLKLWQMKRGNPMPRTSREAFAGAMFLLGIEFDDEKTSA